MLIEVLKSQLIHNFVLQIKGNVYVKKNTQEIIHRGKDSLEPALGQDKKMHKKRYWYIDKKMPIINDPLAERRMPKERHWY